MVTFYVVVVVLFCLMLTEALDSQCLDPSYGNARNCAELANMLSLDSCSVAQDAASYVTVTECLDDQLTFDVEATFWPKTYGDGSRIQLTCINQSSSEIVYNKIVTTFYYGDEHKGLKICDFEFLKEPSIECSLQGCGFMRNECLFKITTSTNITCYESSTAVTHTSTVSHSSMSNSLLSSNSISIVVPTSSSNQHSTSYNYLTRSMTSSNSSPDSELVGNSTSSLLSNSTVEISLTNSNMITKSLVTTLSSDPSTDYSKSSSMELKFTNSNTNSSINSSRLSATVTNLMIVLVAIALPMLVGIVCVFAMSGCIFYINLSKKNNDWYQERQTDHKDSYVRSTVDLNLADIRSATSTIFQDLALQSADNNETAFNVSLVVAETQSCISSVPSSLESSQYQISLKSAVFHYEDSPANIHNSQNTPINTVTHHRIELDDYCVIGMIEDVNCEWDKTRPRSTDLTSNYQQCSDGYHGSVTS